MISIPLKSGLLLLLTSVFFSVLSGAETTFSEAQNAELDKMRAKIAALRALVETTESKLQTTKRSIQIQNETIALLNQQIEDAKIKSILGSDSQNLSSQGKQGADKREALPNRFLNGVTEHIVVIEGDKGNGTGFLCIREGAAYIYTAAHVLTGNRKINVRDHRGNLYQKFDYVECAEGVDLVRLKLSAADADGFEIISEAEAPKIGDSIVAVGNSLGTGSLSGEPGKIKNIQNNFWEVDSEIIPGNSGGPVLCLNTGRVVGIVTHLTIKRVRQQETSSSPAVRRYAARLDKPWKWKKMPVSRFVEEWKYIEKMDRDSSITWASIFLMHTGPKHTRSTLDPNLVRLAHSILAKDKDHFHVQRVRDWLRSYNGAGSLAQAELIEDGNKIIRRNLQDIRAKKTDPKAKDFSWYHRQLFESELDWRKKLTESLD